MGSRLPLSTQEREGSVAATIAVACGCSSMAEHQLPKLNTGVRFSSPAPFVQSARRIPFRSRSSTYAFCQRSECHLVIRCGSCPESVRSRTEPREDLRVSHIVRQPAVREQFVVARAVLCRRHDILQHDGSIVVGLVVDHSRGSDPASPRGAQGPSSRCRGRRVGSR
jgi:hypothetical protein